MAYNVERSPRRVTRYWPPGPDPPVLIRVRTHSTVGWAGGPCLSRTNGQAGGALRERAAAADDRGMITQQPVCECCGRPLDEDDTILVVARDGTELPRHRKCHILELLERA